MLGQTLLHKFTLSLLRTIPFLRTQHQDLKVLPHSLEVLLLELMKIKSRWTLSNATGEHLALSVGNSLANSNFALTDTAADPNGYEFRISSNDLIMSRVTTMNSTPNSTVDFTFSSTGTITATAFSGDGSSLTNVTAATVTASAENIVFTVDNDQGTPVNSSTFSFKNGSSADEVVTISGVGNIGINTTDITTETYTNIPFSSSTSDRSLIVQGNGGVTGSNTAGKGTLVLANNKRGVAGTGIQSSAQAGAIEFIVAGNEGTSQAAGSSDVDDDIDAGDTIAYLISSLSGSGSDDGSNYVDNYGGKISFYTKADNSLSVLERTYS